jgi:hypothetical protein
VLRSRSRTTAPYEEKGAHEPVAALMVKRTESISFEMRPLQVRGVADDYAGCE